MTDNEMVGKQHEGDCCASCLDDEFPRHSDDPCCCKALINPIIISEGVEG